MARLLASKMPRHLARLISLAAPLCVALVWLSCSSLSWSDDRAAVEFFEKKIRPVLIQSCYKCHSMRTDEPKGGLRLDSREAIRRGGDSGPAVVPSQPHESLLLSALRYETLEMPPQNRLPDEVIADFERWIELGAPDPRDRPGSGTVAESWETILNARRDWWSLRPVAAPAIPDSNRDWSRKSLDRFVLAKLEDAKLQPARQANRQVLIRRLSVVLTGVPPTWTEIEQFERDVERDPHTAYEALVDRLLGSPRFGERWARHWLDVVRYTETHGNEWNYEVHHAWRYRDYLIRAFNADVPYDQLVREHIAGDLLDQPRWNQRDQINESVIGTSFYRFGEVNHDDCVTLTAIGYDILDNQIDTLSKAFQATTIACARCHDHKIDAVSMADYYALLGILKSSRLTAHTIDAAAVNAMPLQRLRRLKGEIKLELARHWQEESHQVEQYLLAADAVMRRTPAAPTLVRGLEAQRVEHWVAALGVESADVDDPAWAWQQASAASDLPAAWNAVKEKFANAQNNHAAFNESRFTHFADFRDNRDDGWSDSGQGLRSGASPSGEFTVAPDGDQVVDSILPAGCFTHTLSQKLNGTLRSPGLPPGSKWVSAQLMGDKSSAFRLISNNCQLNYANYRALTSPVPNWVTFPIPGDAQTLQTFAELVTKFDNPKFPDQLGTLGGDRTNHRVPWSEAAADPRSYFGVMQVVLHNEASPPKADLTPTSRLFKPGGTVSSRAELAARYAEAIRSAVHAWSAGQPTDADTYWLSWGVRHQLLDDSVSLSPQLAELVREYRAIEEDEIERPRLAAGLADSGEGRDHPLLERGNYRTPGKTIARRYLKVLSREGRPFPQTGSGRLQLADAIATAENPLTARVLVNRVWHYLFGTGIVRSVDDFGHVGELPSHPDLLDHLTAKFTGPRAAGGLGWSIKRLVRELALSRTFQMSSQPSEAAQSADPQNRLLHSYPARRMEAEAIRDSILAVSGRLSRQLHGPSVQPFREKTNEYRRLFPGPLDGNGRRSIYVKINLMEGPRFLSSFNLPGGKVAQGRRDVTNVPSQALTMLNDPFVLQQAQFWADRLIAEKATTMETRLDRMFRDVLCRPPAPAESARFVALVRHLAELHGVDPRDVLSHRKIWQDVAHVMFNLTEFIYIP